MTIILFDLTQVYIRLFIFFDINSINLNSKAIRYPATKFLIVFFLIKTLTQSLRLIIITTLISYNII